MKKKFFISTSKFGESKRAIHLLKEFNIDFQINPYKRKLTKDEILNFLSNDFIGLIAGTEPLNKEVLSLSKSLKVISRVGVGLDNIDLNTAKELGIKVYNTPDAVLPAVVELTTGLILNALRKICYSSYKLKSGIWEKSMGNLIMGRTVGIIGLGRIGERIADILAFLGANIIFYDIVEKTSKYKQVSLEKLFKKSDIISFHSSGNNLILDEKKFGLLKDGVIIINTARGEAIDEQALYYHLKNKKVSWACIDVFKHEPYQGKLIELENVTLTPHIGSYAREARAEMEYQAVINLLKGLELIK